MQNTCSCNVFLLPLYQQKEINMKAQVGQYTFGRHRSLWGIWQWDSVTETGSSAIFIKDVCSYEEAVREVYRLNGWGQPKYIKRKF